jgi:APA family basic amino acid/polyamine antiporter
MASMIPIAGSAYTYAYATMGELVAWIIGWDLILEYGVSVAAVAVGWGGYLKSLLDSLFGINLPDSIAGPPGDGGTANLPAVFLVLAVTALLIYGVRESARTNTFMVFVKVAILIFFIVVGVGSINGDNFSPWAPHGFNGTVDAAALIFFAYIGFDAVSTAAQEARNPSRDMPIGILGSLAICTVIYMLVAVVLVGIVPYRQLNVADPLAVGIDATGITWLSPVIKVAALFGLFSTMLVQLLGQTRIFYSMSRDGLLPRVFAAVHPRFRTPHVSTVLTGSVIALLAGLTPIGVLGQLVSIGTLLAFVLVSIGVVILRATAPDVPRPFRTPWVPFVPIAGAVICLAQMVGLPLATWERLVIWLAIGLVVYFSYSMRSSLLSSGGLTRDGIQSSAVDGLR